jgi:hypothetical protein
MLCFSLEIRTSGSQKTPKSLKIISPKVRKTCFQVTFQPKKLWLRGLWYHALYGTRDGNWRLDPVGTDPTHQLDFDWMS